MEHKHWSIQWVRGARSAVDYLAAAVGGDRGQGPDKGAAGERVVGNPLVLEYTGGNGVCMPGPSGDWCVYLPHSSPHTANSHSPLHSFPQLLPYSSIYHTAPHTHVHMSEC